MGERGQPLSFQAMVGDLLQPTHLLFVLVVALLVLGPKRLPEVGRALGRGLRDFRHAMSGEEHSEPTIPPATGSATTTANAPAEPASETMVQPAPEHASDTMVSPAPEQHTDPAPEKRADHTEPAEPVAAATPSAETQPNS